MSTELLQVVTRLQTDLSFATDFLNSPTSALQGYNLPEHEYHALVTRNTNELVQLGLDQNQVWAMDSGAHSQRCSK